MTREEVIETLAFAVLFDVASVEDIQDVIDLYNKRDKQAEQNLKDIICETERRFSYANYATNIIIAQIGHRQFNSYVKQYGVAEAMKMSIHTLELTSEISKLV